MIKPGTVRKLLPIGWQNEVLTNDKAACTVMYEKKIFSIDERNLFVQKPKLKYNLTVD